MEDLNFYYADYSRYVAFSLICLSQAQTLDLC